MSAGSVRANDRGDFSKAVRASNTGTWKAISQGTATRAAATRTRVIQAYTASYRQIAAYQATASSWQGPTIRIPTADYRAVVTYHCTDPSGGFLYLHWNGQPYGYESVGSSLASGTLTLNGHNGARYGYFDVSAWIDCSWSVTVYSGLVRTLV